MSAPDDSRAGVAALAGAPEESGGGFLDAGGASESAERVRRILLQIAPEMLPSDDGLPLPAGTRPPAPRDEDGES